MNDKIEIKPQVISPLKKMCMTIGEIPASYLETMTYYEMLVWFTNYLKNTIIPVINNNGEAVTELQNLFVKLQTYVNNYFDNLDVQEEIDNKLDEMVEAGTLQEIIADYLNSKAFFGFDSVSNMKSATNLINGSYAETLGYYNINDGGKAKYKIRQITNEDIVDEMTIIALNDENLIAELIEDTKNTLNVLQCGAYPDGITDNTTIFNKIIDYANETFKNIYIPQGKYLINNDLHDINGCISIYGDISGEGQREYKTTIVDNRSSSNYLFNFISASDETAGVKGGCVSYLNFTATTLNTKKCIKITDSINYLGNINNCNFLDFAIGLYVDRSHGFVLDTCAFVRCGGKQENVDEFAIMINETTDLSINNSCIDHCRYQMWVNGQSMVYISNSHFEISKKNIVKGKEPIYCLMGNYGYISFSNCSFINLSYKEWIESAGYTINNCIYMIYASYASFVNCMFSCGSGSGQSTSIYTKQAKFVHLYYGSIDNCKVKSPSYLTPSFHLNRATFINNHIQCDIEEEDFEINKNLFIVNSPQMRVKNNYLQYVIPTLDPQIYPTNYPILSNNYCGKTYVDTNKNNIFFVDVIPYSDINNINTLRIQSRANLMGAYHLKIYSIGETKLFYDGYIRINSDKSITEISYNEKSFGSGNKIEIFSDDDSNDIYIQILEPEYKTNTIVFDMENLEGHVDTLLYFDNNIQTELTYTNKLDLSA